jgi:hypothetical protein
MLACDFLYVDTALLQCLYVLFVMEVDPGCTSWALPTTHPARGPGLRSRSATS